MIITLDWTIVAALLVWTVLAFWLGRITGGGNPRDLSGPPPQMVMPKPSAMPSLPTATPGSEGLTPARLEAIRGALATGNKIMAIKLYREATGTSLLEAKNAVEAMER